MEGCALEQKESNPVSCPLISVIIPCHDQAHFLGRAIHSCLTGCARSIEIIVIDDGSSDNVPGVLEEFGQEIRLITTPNRGLPAARNTGLRSAKGRFIKFLDADDWLMPGSLDRQVAILQQAPDDTLLITGFRYCFAEPCRPDEDHYPEFGLWQEGLAHHNHSPIHAFLVPRNITARLGEFDEDLKIFEDYDYWLRAVLLEVRVLVMHSVECVYYRHDSNMSRNQKSMRKGGLAVWKRHALLIAKQSTCPIIKAAFIKSCSRFLIQYPDDLALKDIAVSLFNSISSLEEANSPKVVLEISQAIADLLLAYPHFPEMKDATMLPLKLIGHLDYHFTNFEKHHLQQRLFEISQRFLQGGQEKIARQFLSKVRDLPSGYGLDYRMLARLQMALTIIFPGPIVAALLIAGANLLESYWKHLKRFLYKLICLTNVDKS